MIIQMSRPWRHPYTGVFYFRSRIPSQVRSSLDARTITVDVAGIASQIKVAPILKVSLRTRDKSEAQLRHAAVQSQMQQRWTAARNGATSLSAREVEELAGEWYRDFVSSHEDNPGDPESWSIYQDLLFEGLAYFDTASDGVENPPFDPKAGMRLLSRHFDIDAFLAARGLILDTTSRTKLVERTAWALIRAAQTVQRRAQQDWGPDETAQQFPVRKAPRAASGIASGATLQELFEGWAKESKPAQATQDLWRSYLTSFTQFTGKHYASSIERSDVVRWKQRLIEFGNSPSTINGGKLAALNVIFRWGVANELLQSNPAQGVSVRRSTKPGEDMKGFDKREAAIILEAAARQSDPVCRWVPLLCAQSGARVAEICQLRKEDVKCEDGIHYLQLRADAGSLKNRNSERQIPLHPHVIEVGFLDFVRRSSPGPLFYDPSKRRPGAKKPQPKIVAKNVARWVHTLGFAVGLRARKAPNHAWRHMFSSVTSDEEIPENVVNAIMGLAPRNQREAYGKVSLAVKTKYIARIRLPGVQ